MNIKSLLLGSAAALAVVSGAQAADAIVAAEPEAVEYVRVCDAYGTGYFYIPGTETCLQIGGWVRFQVNYGDSSGADGSGIGRGAGYDASGRGYFYLQTKNDTEYGTLTGFIALEGDVSGQSDGSSTPYVDEAYLQLGGFKAGWYYNWWDKGLNGEEDTNNGGGNEWVSASYTYESDAFSAGVAIDEIDTDASGANAANDQNNIGFEGLLTATFGGVSLDLLGSYDLRYDEGAIRGLLSADIGPGTLQAFVVWASGYNVYWNASEWSVAASYAIKATDKLTITPGGQYFWNQYTAATADFDGDDYWNAGVTVDYKITDGLAAKVDVDYVDPATGDGYVKGFFRLQRSF